MLEVNVAVCVECDGHQSTDEAQDSGHHLNSAAASYQLPSLPGTNGREDDTQVRTLYIRDT